METKVKTIDGTKTMSPTFAEWKSTDLDNDMILTIAILFSSLSSSTKAERLGFMSIKKSLDPNGYSIIFFNDFDYFLRVVGKKQGLHYDGVHISLLSHSIEVIQSMQFMSDIRSICICEKLVANNVIYQFGYLEQLSGFPNYWNSQRKLNSANILFPPLMGFCIKKKDVKEVNLVRKSPVDYASFYVPFDRRKPSTIALFR